MTPEERGDLAERLLPIAAGLACIVHGDGDQRDITNVLAQLDPVEQTALIVVLAGLVQPDQPLTDALSYLTWDETGRPDPWQTRSDRTIRELARVIRYTPSGVEQTLTDEQRMAALVLHRHHGYDQRDVARRLGVHERTVSRWVSTPREQVTA